MKLSSANVCKNHVVYGSELEMQNKHSGRENDVGPAKGQRVSMTFRRNTVLWCLCCTPDVTNKECLRNIIDILCIHFDTCMVAAPPTEKKRSIKNMGGKYCWKLTDMDGKVFIEIVQLVNIVGLIFMPWYVNPFHWHVLNPSHCKVPIKCCIDRVAFLFNFRLKKQCWSDDPVLKVKVHSSR